MLRFLYKFSIFVICSHLLGADGATLKDEIKEHNVTLTFYMMSSDEWSAKESGFKAELIKQVNAYCQQNKEECGVTSTTTLVFTENEYKVADGYPKDDGSNAQVQFYLTFPSTVNASVLTNPPKTTYLLNKQAIEAVVLSSRPALREAVGYWITFIDDDQYGPPPNWQINNIMIPLACAILVILCIITIALYCEHKNRTKREKRKRREAMKSSRKRQNIVGPQPQGQPGAGGNWNGSGGGTEQWFISESEHAIEGGGHHPTKGPPPYHTIEVPDDTRHHRGLPPLEDENGDPKRKDKKKKKHRKHKKHGKEDPENVQNSASDPEATRQDIERHKLISEQVQMSALSGRLTDPGATRHQNVNDHTDQGDTVYIAAQDPDEERLGRNTGFI